MKVSIFTFILIIYRFLNNKMDEEFNLEWKTCLFYFIAMKVKFYLTR